MELLFILIIIIAAVLALLAVENVVGTNMTLATNSPPDMVSHRQIGGSINVSIDRFTMAASASALSTYHCARLPREAVIVRAEIYQETGAADIDDLDFGELNALGGAGFDAALGEAIDTAAAAGWFDLLNSVAAADFGKELWELLGYASRTAAPAQIDLACSLDAALTANATNCVVRIEWTGNN